MRRSHDIQQQALLHLSGKASAAATEQELVQALRKKCTACYDEFRTYCENNIDNHWAAITEDYGTEQYSIDREKWDDYEQAKFEYNCRNRNYLEVGRYFDLMAWWRDFSVQFRFLYPSAMIWLAKPATNAFQERVFSIGAWMHQNKLMGSLSKKANEMCTMDYINRDKLVEILNNENDVRNCVGTSLSYVPETGPSPRKNEQATTQRQSLKLTAIQEVKKGFKSYTDSSRSTKNVLKDPNIVMTFIHTSAEEGPIQPDAEVSQEGDSKQDEAFRTKEDEKREDGNHNDVQDSELGKKDDDRVEQGSKAEQGSKVNVYNMNKKANKDKSPPVMKVANRVKFVKVPKRFNDDSDDESIDFSSSDEDSDNAIDNLIDENLPSYGPTKDERQVVDRQGEEREMGPGQEMGTEQEMGTGQAAENQSQKRKKTSSSFATRGEKAPKKKISKQASKQTTMSATSLTTLSNKTKKKTKRQQTTMQPKRVSPRKKKGESSATATAVASIAIGLSGKQNRTTPPSARLVRKKQRKEELEKELEAFYDNDVSQDDPQVSDQINQEMKGVVNESEDEEEEEEEEQEQDIEENDEGLDEDEEDENEF